MLGRPGLIIDRSIQTPPTPPPRIDFSIQTPPPAPLELIFQYRPPPEMKRPTCTGSTPVAYLVCPCLTAIRLKIQEDKTLRIKDTSGLHLNRVRPSHSFSGSGAVILEDPGELLS